MIEIICRVCNLPIPDGKASYDPEVDFSRWDESKPWVIHRDCVPKALKEMVERLQTDPRTGEFVDASANSGSTEKTATLPRTQ